MPDPVFQVIDVCVYGVLVGRSTAISGSPADSPVKFPGSTASLTNKGTTTVTLATTNPSISMSRAKT